MKLAVLGLGSSGTRHAQLLIEAGHEVIGFDPAGGTPPPGVVIAASEDAAIEAAEAVIIATPSSLHEEQCLRVLSAGRHVLVEKPLASDLAGGRRIVAAADIAERRCSVAMNLRFHPAVETLGELVEGGTLGKPLYARVSFGFDLQLWRPGTDYRTNYSAVRKLGGGILLDAIHELDYLVSILGPAAEASAAIGQLSDLETDVEDCVVGWVRLRSGALATLDLNAFEPAYRRGCVVVGTDARATWDWQSGSLTVTGRDDSSVIDVGIALRETYRRELDNFVQTLTGSRVSRAPAEDTLASLALADALRTSSETGATARVETV